MKKTILIGILCLAGLSFAFHNNTEDAKKPKWQTLFNGKDIDDWSIKIRTHELNDNFANTFRVEDGLMKVRYDGYDQFDQQYGHIFYNEPFSNYLLQVEYRFVGDQANGGEGWATRNSGAMLHSQDPKTMLKDQDFPISIEAQFLGGNGTDKRSTCNLCTPGNPVDPKVKVDGQMISGGYISLQSESHPIDFRTVRLIDLSEYMGDQKKLTQVVNEGLSAKPAKK